MFSSTGSTRKRDSGSLISAFSSFCSRMIADFLGVGIVDLLARALSNQSPTHGKILRRIRYEAHNTDISTDMLPALGLSSVTDATPTAPSIRHTRLAKSARHDHGGSRRLRRRCCRRQWSGDWSPERLETTHMICCCSLTVTHLPRPPLCHLERWHDCRSTMSQQPFSMSSVASATLGTPAEIDGADFRAHTTSTLPASIHGSSTATHARSTDRAPTCKHSLPHLHLPREEPRLHIPAGPSKDNTRLFRCRQLAGSLQDVWVGGRRERARSVHRAGSSPSDHRIPAWVAPGPWHWGAPLDWAIVLLLDSRCHAVHV
eukprot:m.347027 g.347027  ORF g.347027 m.347027 type:complete len:316 (-) comp27919_c0_seq1:451-1398(-)